MNTLLEWYIRFVTFSEMVMTAYYLGVILQISILGWIKLIRE